jgi:hypothetical protein
VAQAGDGVTGVTDGNTIGFDGEIAAGDITIFVEFRSPLASDRIDGEDCPTGAGRLEGKVAVIVDDRPGQLARLFADVGAAGANVEDVRIDHSPGQPVGMVEIDVRPGTDAALRAALTASGWRVP